MCTSASYTIHGRHHHHGWDRSFPPAERVAPGSRVRFECLDSSGGQFTRDSVTADVPNLAFDRINPVTGPIYVDGAAPGDVLKVEIEAFHPSGFGWTANIPGFGLLADQFTDPALKVWSYDAGTLAPALFSDVARVPLKPFAGTIGVAPGGAGHHSVVPPRRVGGNLDIRDLAAGATLCCRSRWRGSSAARSASVNGS
jgi:acetamidase/formamidase